MALSGDFSNTVVNGLGISCKWSATQSISGNYSDLTISVTMDHVGAYMSATRIDVYVGGEVVGSISVPSMNGNDSSTSGTVTARVYHDSDGTMKNLEIKALWPFSITYSGVSRSNISASDTVTLDTIIRVSTITSAANVVLGNRCSISWTPQSTSLAYKLKFSMSSWSYTTGMISPGVTTGYTYTGYIIPLETIAELMPNSVSATMSVTLFTYPNSSSSSYTGTSPGSFTVTIPTSVVPSIISLSAEIDNTNNDVVAGWGVALAGYSRVKISCAANGVYGSTINSFSITGSHVANLPGSALEYTTGVITSSGNKVFDVTCTDSRARTSDPVESNIIQFLGYVPPVINKFSVDKNTASENSSEITMSALVEWEIDSVEGHNSATAGLYYKLSTASDWTYYGDLENGVSTQLNISFSDENSYNFRIVVTDALGKNVQKDAFSSTAQVLMDFRAGGKGLGIGKISEMEAMEVAMRSIFYDEVCIGNKDQTLEMYIRDVMKVLSEEMYGADPSTVKNPVIGQIYFKKVS